MHLAERLRTYVDGQKCYGRYGYRGLDFRCRRLFATVPNLDGASLLEIGGGDGLFSIWAVAQGVKRAAILEPEAAGSTARVRERFARHRERLGIPAQVLDLLPLTFQQYDPGSERFRVVLSVNSVNHMDEEACENLHRDPSSRQVFRDLFRKIHDLLEPGGTFVVADAARVNYWDRLGLRSPLMPSIEWEKHQEPELWAEVAAEAGFSRVAVDWYCPYPLRWLGTLGRNRFFARLTTSCFILTLRRSD